MLWPAAKSSTEGAATHVWDDVSGADPVLVSKSNHLSSFPFWHHQDWQPFAQDGWYFCHVKLFYQSSNLLGDQHRIQA